MNESNEVKITCLGALLPTVFYPDFYAANHYGAVVRGQG
jgi:hypothetical protein